MYRVFRDHFSILLYKKFSVYDSRKLFKQCVDDDDVYPEYYSGKGTYINYSVYMSYVKHINSSNKACVKGAWTVILVPLTHCFNIGYSEIIESKEPYLIIQMIVMIL
jgi:hypothetical protein